MSPVGNIDARIGSIEARMAELTGRFPGTASPSASADGAAFGALLAGSSAALDAGALGGAATTTIRPQTTVSSTGLPRTDGLGGTGVGTIAADAAGSAAVTAAMQYLGIPYLWGGTEADTGFDCSGLVQQAYADIGVDMPKWSRHQAQMGVEVPSIELARPGDVLAFGEPVNHVALYVGNGQMLHAPRTGEVVKVEAIDRPIATIRRIVDVGGATATPLTGATPTASGPATTATEASLQPLFEQAGAAHGIDPALLAAVASVESSFRPDAVSPAGAQGLMQFMPATAAELGVDPFDVASAIDGAARYLRSNLDRFGSIELALAAYNAGPGAVSQHGGIPPYPETQNYVTDVTRAWRARS